MTADDYKRMPMRMLKHRQAQSNRGLRNSYGSVPAGTRLRLIAKLRHTFTVETADPCPHCGAQLVFSNVHPHTIDLLPEETPAETPAETPGRDAGREEDYMRTIHWLTMPERRRNARLPAHHTQAQPQILKGNHRGQTST